MLGFRFKAVLWIHGRLLLRCAGRWLQATWNHKEKRCQSTDTWAFIPRGTESFIGCAKTWKFPFCFCHLLNYTSKTLEKIVGFGSLSTNSQDSIWGRCLTICISSEISWIPFRYLNSSMKPFHKQRNNSSLTHYEGMSYEWSFLAITEHTLMQTFSSSVYSCLTSDFTLLPSPQWRGSWNLLPLFGFCFSQNSWDLYPLWDL